MARPRAPARFPRLQRLARPPTTQCPMVVVVAHAIPSSRFAAVGELPVPIPALYREHVSLASGGLQAALFIVAARGDHRRPAGAAVWD